MDWGKATQSEHNRPVAKIYAQLDFYFGDLNQSTPLSHPAIVFHVLRVSSMRGLCPPMWSGEEDWSKRGRPNPPVAVWTLNLLELYSFFIFLNPGKGDSGPAKHSEQDPKQCPGLALSGKDRGGGSEIPLLEAGGLGCRKASLSTSFSSGLSSSGLSLVLKTSLSNELAGLPVFFHSMSTGGDGDANILLRHHPCC